MTYFILIIGLIFGGLGALSALIFTAFYIACILGGGYFIVKGIRHYKKEKKEYTLALKDSSQTDNSHSH